MNKILKLNSYSQYDELGERDYMVYEVKYDDGHKEYVSRDIFRNLKALEFIKEIAKTYDIEFCDSKQTISFKIMLKDKFILEIIAIQDKEEYELLKEVMS